MAATGHQGFHALKASFQVNTDVWNGENYHLQCPRRQHEVLYTKMLSQSLPVIVRFGNVVLCAGFAAFLLLHCWRLQFLGVPADARGSKFWISCFLLALSFGKMHNDRRNLPQAAKAGVFSPRFFGWQTGREVAETT